MKAHAVATARVVPSAQRPANHAPPRFPHGFNLRRGADGLRVLKRFSDVVSAPRISCAPLLDGRGPDDRQRPCVPASRRERTIMVLHRRRLVGLVFVLMTGCADKPSPTAP